MKSLVTTTLITILFNSSFAQVRDICLYMTTTDTLMVESDSTVALPEKNAVFRIPKGWHGSMGFDGPGFLRLQRTYSDSTEFYLVASEAWLVEFHEEYVARQKEESTEYCEFVLNDYIFSVYKIENEPITMFYQIARTDRDQDGWTWFFRIVGVAKLTKTMKSDLRSIITQVVEISGPNRN